MSNTIEAYAKINLGLNIVSKRADGYHNLETVFYPVYKIKDTLTIDTDIPECQVHKCEITINGLEIAGNSQDNLIVKAYNLLDSKYSLPRVRITLDKRIPTQAGMGGGSSDCTATFRLLNDRFNLNISNDDMRSMAATLGADCAFFIDSQPSFATGIGEILEPVNVSLDNYEIVVVKPDIAVSTKEAFSKITPHKPEKCCKDIVQQPIETWRTELTNDFEQSIFALYPEIGKIKESLYNDGAVYAAMSGSGSAVFGIFRI